MVSSVPFFMSSLFIMVVAYCTLRVTLCQNADAFAKPCILSWARRYHESDSHDRSIGTRDRCPDSGARQCVSLDGASGARWQASSCIAWRYPCAIGPGGADGTDALPGRPD